MATKRMFSRDIIEGDKFLDLPFNSQLLYFHLGMHADVKGFIEPKKIIRMIGLKIEDLRYLVDNGFVIVFDSGVVVITHWNINNQTREDRESVSQFPKECAQLRLSVQGKYEITDDSRSTPGELPHRLDKVRLDKVSTYVPPKGDTPELFIKTFNERTGRNYQITKARTNKLTLRLKTFTFEQILKALDNMVSDKFYKGFNDRAWVADPDFLIRSDEQIDKFLNKPDVTGVPGGVAILPDSEVDELTLFERKRRR